MLKEEIGKKLKEARIQVGLTQKEVADRLGVAQPIYQRFEKGIYECSYEQLKALCDLFDISADYLLGRKEF
ncbi:MAG: helix-turn-helix transcriptional regulator [Clostridiales bacterium]|nr:helix-turn-helix transcriptional regulator [Clostridiales bacterium]